MIKALLLAWDLYRLCKKHRYEYFKVKEAIIFHKFLSVSDLYVKRQVAFKSLLETMEEMV